MEASGAKQRRRAAVLLALLLLMHGGCVSRGPEPGHRARALSMTPQSSERYQCGPSTLRS